MRVLWTVNLIPRNVTNYFKKDSVVLGGWVESMASQLKDNAEIKLGIACKCEPKYGFDRIEIDNVTYYSVPYTPSESYENVKKIAADIIEDFKPDIVHIEGTEFIHAKAFLFVSKEKKIKNVASMQGILNGYYNYQCGNMQIDELMFSKSLTNMVAGWYLHFRKTKWFRPRMKPEREIIEAADNILGRTSWDRAHSYSINPKADYYIVNRTLRAPFYEYNWDVSKIQRHSIYVGNGYIALKGLQFVIEAIPQLVREYPDLMVYVAGNKPFLENDKRPLYKRSFGAYIEKLIKDLGVAEYIEFTGPLTANEVAEKLSMVNAYVLCSAIENSPNTLGEAMIVGTPSVSAYVGGVSDMAVDGKEVLFYRNDDSSILAWNVKKIFDDDIFALKLSENAKKHARITHDAKKNADDLLNAYKEINKK